MRPVFVYAGVRAAARPEQGAKRGSTPLVTARIVAHIHPSPRATSGSRRKGDLAAAAEPGRLSGTPANS